MFLSWWRTLVTVTSRQAGTSRRRRQRPFPSKSRRPLSIEVLEDRLAPALTITTTMLANWTVNLPGYSQAISATGGMGTVTFSKTGMLPTGLTLSNNGVLSGTPTLAGTYSFMVTATDILSDMANQSYMVTINPAVGITTATLVNGEVGLAYSQTISATGGTGAKTFATTAGAVPTGLTLSGAGVLSGTPMTVGTFPFTVKATDTVGAGGSQPYAVTVAPASPALATTANPTTEVVGTAALKDSATLSAGFNPTGTITFTLMSPSSTVVDAETVPVSGNGTYTTPAGAVPATTGAYFWVASYSGDSDNQGAASAHEPVLVTAASPALATTANPTTEVVGTAALKDSATLSAAFNPTGTITFTLTAPSSTVVDTETVPVSGNGTYTTPTGAVPTTIGAYFWAASYSGDSNNQGATSANEPVTINPPLTITTTMLPNWTANLPGYSQTITATGGVGTITFSETGMLPTGLALSNTGVLSGTPTLAGTYSFTVTATDISSDIANQSYMVTINPVVTIAPTTLPNWTVNQPGYNQTITAIGGTGSKTFATTAGNLPTGLTLLSTSGMLSGTPTTVGSYTFTVTATDTLGASGSQNYTVIVNPALATNPPGLPGGTAGTAYAETITVSGGTTPYTTLGVTGFNAGGTGLSPSQIDAIASTGTVTINGTPTGAGTATFTVNVTDTAGATLSQSYALSVNPAPATHFLVSAPSPEAANGFFNITVTAEDMFNNVVPGYEGLVHFTSTDTAAALPADSTLMNGQGTFTVTLRTLGNQTITATDTMIPALTGTSGNIDVVCPIVVIVSPSFVGAPGTAVFGHTIGFDAFPTIQQGVNVVCPGGTVYVNAATYDENVTIDKSLTLQGSGSASAILMGSTSDGVGLAITGPSVSVGGLTVENFTTGLTAGSPTTTLILSDLKLTGNTAGGTITGVTDVTFTGNATNETLIATATQFGRSGDNLLTYSGVTLLALDGNLGNNTLDLSSAAGAVGVALTGPGSLEGFAGTATLPGLIFTNISQLTGNGAVGSALAGLNAPATWTVNTATTSQYTSGGQTLTFTGFSTLYGGAAADSFAINGDSASGLNVNGQGGGDSFQVAFGALAGPVTLNDVGGSGVNTAALNASNSSNSMTVTSSAVTWNSTETVNYAGLEGLMVNAGAGTDALDVQGTAAGTPTTVSGGGTDAFVVTSMAGLLNGIAAPLTLNGGSGNNSLDVSEAAATTGDTVFMTNSLIYSNAVGGFKPISYQATGGTFGGGVSLSTGQGDDIVNVQSTRADATTVVNTGGGNDFVLVTSDPSGDGTLAGINGPLAIDEGTGSNRLEVSEAAATTGDTFFMTNSLIYSNAVGGFKVISYQATGGTFGGGVSLYTGQGDDIVNVQSTRADATTYVNTGGGNDFVLVSSNPSGNGTLAGINGPLAIDEGTGTNRLEVSEAAATTADTVSMTASLISSTAVGSFAPISYQATGGTFGNQQEQTSAGTIVPAGIALYLGQAGNNLNFTSQLPGASTFIQMGNGPASNVANIDVFSNSAYSGLTVDLGTGVNTLNVTDRSGGGQSFLYPGPVARTGKYVVVYSGSSSEIDFVGATFQPLF